MHALVQRVAQASVTVSGTVTGAIGPGLMVLLCAEQGDGTAQADRLLDKVLRLRILADDAGRMNHSVQDTGGGLLIVSQFTLAADTRRGNRPSFTAAAPPDLGCRLYDHFVLRAQGLHPIVATGRFGADMRISMICDGPVTIPLRIPPPG